MKELLQDYAIKALVWLESGVGFIAGEIPKYVEELLKWKFTEELFDVIFFVILGVIFLVAGILLLKKGLNLPKRKNYYGSVEYSA